MTATLLPQDSVGAWLPHGRFVREGRAGGPLARLRFAVKDVFDVAGVRTGAGNPRWLETHEPARASSPLVDQLLDAGATLVGKVLTDELAYSIHGDNMHYGTPVNARAPGRVPGGSSSGSAAAVAARLVDFALGTDTGGSTRVPASYCGIWGLRPTHGRLSQEGLVPLHPSFDTPTWLAHDPVTFRTVGSVLLAPQAFPGWSRAVLPVDAWAQADEEFLGLRDDFQRAVQEATGLRVETMAPGTLPLESWRQVYAASGAHEAWQAHGAWIERHKPVLSPAIAQRFAAASAVSTEAAARARASQLEIRDRLRALLTAGGLALLPSAASLAPARGAAADEVDAVRLRTMRITCMAGLAGLPQVSIPCFTRAGVPLGLSLVGPPGSDGALIELALQVHAALPPDLTSRD